MDKARAEAVRIGKSRADLYARAAGMKVRRILSMSEQGSSQPMPMPMPRVMAMEAKADSPIAPGEVRLAAMLTMVFELE